MGGRIVLIICYVRYSTHASLTMYMYVTDIVHRFGGGSSQVQSGDGGDEIAGDKKTAEAKPNYGLSGKLTAETNTYKVWNAVGDRIWEDL